VEAIFGSPDAGEIRAAEVLLTAIGMRQNQVERIKT
jgi:hypothetical protein